jgi:hypothetical protein
MSQNRRRHNNPVPVGDLSPWIMVAIIVLIGCLTCVYYMNLRLTRGHEIKDLERELADLKTRNDALRPHLAELSSRTALQRRLNEGFVKMVPITQDRIVQVAFKQSPVEGSATDEIRAVSNEGAMR